MTLRLVAEHAQMWNSSQGLEEFAYKTKVLDEWCQKIGRDPKEIRTSVHVVFNAEVGPQAAVDKAAEFGALGVDLAIFYLPSPHRASIVEALGEAIARS